MKTKPITLLLLIAMLLNGLTGIITAQDSVYVEQSNVQKLFIVIKNDGTEFIGYIISRDEREVLLDTETIGQVVIPKHEIREIREVDQKDMRDGVFIGSNIFSSRYFLTTNGLSMKKGENYALISLYGPEAHFCLADNFTLGGLTSWVGVPLVVSLKYSFHMNENLHFGLGVLGGSLSWLDFGSVGGLVYGSVTVGNHINNLTFSGGYAGVTDGEDISGSEPLFSVAGMVKLGKNISLVGDSFIYAGENPFAIIMPGLRFSRSERKAFQFGFAGIIIEGEAIPFPIPMLGWFLKI
ncbi:MAG: hypothetical protein KAR19_07390 [Bacteroidales bacterium]|nr:hypothetical protein [Bacteroidales bacterium]